MLKDDGTNFYFGVRNDPNNIQITVTVSRTAFFTSIPIKIGMMEDWNDTTHLGIPLAATFIHYSRSDGAP